VGGLQLRWAVCSSDARSAPPSRSGEARSLSSGSGSPGYARRRHGGRSQEVRARDLNPDLRATARRGGDLRRRATASSAAGDGLSSGGRRCRWCRCSGGGVGVWGRERRGRGRNEGVWVSGGGLGVGRGQLQCSAGMDSPRPRCEARFQLLTRAWLRGCFRRRWAWLKRHMQANKHSKVGWTENLLVEPPYQTHPE
jgi:hypothetical protein